ncbi:MAG: hypothetical protein H6744_21525 [Deltaproteobacteria bacterium]|nr:hypothetical protein [Deltaproteobacteria bacterium]MCB9789265.1 hypothetical protein [Deltaproteobacteria bacterium]
MDSRRLLQRLVSLCFLAVLLAACEPTTKQKDADSSDPDVGFADVPVVIPDTAPGTDADAEADADATTPPDQTGTPDADIATDAGEDAELTPDVTTPPDVKVETDVACVPDCNGRVCGPDGCGGLCGFCTHPQVCNEFGQCVAICVTKCDGKDCGPDGCGGLCGECSEELECGEVDQLCHEKDCVPDCEGKVCGSDGCGSTCGTCAAPKVCEAGACFLGPCGTVDAEGECQGTAAVWCEDLTVLKEDDCALAPGYKCQYNPNAKRYQCLPYVCEPNCDGKLCGDDGCGGICAPGCSTGWSCAAGACKPEQGANCGSITKAGQCTGDTLWFCANKVLYSLDCTDTGEKCKWDQSALEFACQ